MGSGFNFFTNAIDKTPGTTGSWQDVDVSADIPSGSTGVILELINEGGANFKIAVRKKGSTDDRSATSKVYFGGHIYALCGVDANRIFQDYVENSSCKIYLVGYTDTAVTFETNAIDKSTGTIQSWVDVDISATAPADATGVIAEMICSVASYVGAIRKNGSSDDRSADSAIAAGGHIYLLCGIDQNKVFEQYIANSNVDLFIVGYTKAPIMFFTNAIDKSLTATSAWTDIDITADTTPDTDGAILEIHNTHSTTRYKGAVRKNGSSDDRTAYSKIGLDAHIFGLVGTDANQIFEGWIESNAVDFYLIGYCKPAGQTYTKTWQSDVLFKKLGITKTSAFDAAFKKSDIAKTFGLDIGIQKRDIQLQKQVDTLFRKLDILKQFGIDVDLLKQDVLQTFAIDVRFGAVVSHELSKQLDALFKKFEISKTFAVDVDFQRTQELQRQVDALFRKAFTTTKQVDVLFKKLAILKQFNVDADLVGKGISKAFALDVILGVALTHEISKQLDVLFKKLGLPKPFTVDVDFRKTSEVQRQIDALLRKLDVQFQRQVDILLCKAGIERAFAVDVRIGVAISTTYAKAFGIDVMFRYRIKLPSSLGMTLDGQLVIPLKKEIWIGD